MKSKGLERRISLATAGAMLLGVALVSTALAGVPVCGNGTVTPPETCDPPGSRLPNGNTCRKDCTFCGDKIINDGEQCEPPGTDSCSAVCTTCPGSLCANPAVGAAGDCTVLELNGGNVSMTGPAGGVLGDVCIGRNGKLDMSGSQFVNGNVRLASGATFQRSGSTTVGNVLTNQDLSPEINAALAAASSAASLPCTQSFTKLTPGQTVVGTGGQNVICVQDVVLQAGQTITFKGGSSDTFIVDVSGQFVNNGGHLVASGVRPKDILYNIIGTGSQVAFTGGGGGTGCCNATADGTLLAPNRKIALSPGLVNGDIISGLDISIVSGAAVRCPPAPCGTSGTCASPTVIPAAGGTVSGTTSGSSALSGSCGGSSAPEQVFSWTPSKTGSATIKTCGANTKFDTVLYVRSGGCTGKELACNDDSCSSGDVQCGDLIHASSVTLNVTSGQAYTIVVDGFSPSCGNSSGAFELTVIPPP